MNGINRRALLLLGGSAALLARATDTADATLAAWQRAERIPLWPAGAPDSGTWAPQPLPAGASPLFVRNVAVPELRVFRPATPRGAAVLVIPGGSYEFVSIGNEGVEIAAQLTALGYVVCVLTYRLPAEGWRERSAVPLQDAQRALRVIRSRAATLAIDATRVAVVGFSAGGHLAAMLSTAHARTTYAPLDAADRLSARPFASGLVYPVVTMAQRWTHASSRLHLLGAEAGEPLVAAWSAERLVDATTPPAFLAHACDDDAVPVENSLAYLEAMRRAGRPVEAHLFQEGRHAFGVGRPGTPSADWIPLFTTWLQRL